MSPDSYTKDQEYPGPAALLPMIPLDNWIIIDRIDEPEKIGRIYVPEVAKDQSQVATVMAVGPGKMTDVWDKNRQSVQGGFRRRPLDPRIVPGARVLVGRHRGAIVEWDGKKYYCVEEHEVIAILTEEAP